MTALAQHQEPPPESHYTDLSPRHHVTMHQPETAKNVTVYMNGDQYYPGRKFVVNRRHIADFDGFLNMVTVGLKPAFGAVRNIYTPNYGHKVTELDGFNNGMAVVAGGQERFKKLHYKEITPPSKRQGKPRNDYAAIRPVYHNTRMNVAARWKDFAKGPCNVHVYVNGDINGSAAKMLLIPRILKDYGLVLQEVTEKLAARTGRAVRRLYNMHGELVTGTDHLENGGYYVACGNEKFKRLPYGERAQHMAMMHSVKKPQVQLPPIRRRVRTLNSNAHDPSYSQKHAVRKQFEGERQQQSQPPPGASKPPPGASRPPPNRRLRPIKGAGPPPSSESESVFHAKPVKVKRSGASGKITAVSATDGYDDDVFRAKPTQIRAEEVDDDEDTKVDLPIDQVPADTVEHEDLHVAAEQEEPEKIERSPEPKSTFAPRLEEGDSVVTERSKTPTSASREEPHPSVRSVENTAPNGAVIQPSEDQPVKNKETKKSKTEDEAAVLIQSAYKGYKVRKEFKKREKTAEYGRSDPDPDGLENVEPAQKETEEATELTPPSRPRSETIEGPGTVSQDTSEPQHPDDTHDQPIKVEENGPTSAETQSVELPLPDTEGPQDVTTEQSAPPADDDKEVPAEEQGPGPVPNAVDETEPVPNTVDETEPVPNTVDETEPLPNTVDETEPAPNTVDETEPVPNTVDETEPAPNTVDETEPVPNTVDETEPVPNAVDETEPVPNAVDETEPVQNTVDETEPVPNTVDETEPVPNTVDETEPAPNTVVETEPDRHSPTEETKSSEPAVEAVHEDKQPSPRPSSPENAENYFTAPKNEGEPGLPERDAGDGTEESEAQQRQPNDEDHRLNDEAQLNGGVPVADVDDHGVRANQDSAARSGSVTEGDDDAEQPQKGALDAGQISNGQPANTLEGGV